MNYPLISEYIESIKAAEDNFEKLSYLRPVLGDDGLPVMTSGNFAVVFKMKDEREGKLYAVKCFTKEQEGRAEAYREIAKELEKILSPYILSIRYLDKELFVDTDQTSETEFPVLLMDWVEGKTLDKYLRENLDDKYALEMLAYRFSQLAQWLIPQPFAHGDLKPDNILVREDGTLVLVDYDGMYVPAMKGQKARELGSPDFRHPQRTENDFDEHIDDFPLVSILLSLKAISINPQLWSDLRGTGDGLLLSEKDYRNVDESKLIKIIHSYTSDLELKLLLDLMISIAIVRYKYSSISNYKPISLISPLIGLESNIDGTIIDKYGAIFSHDKKKLLKGVNIQSYFVPYGTEVISEKAFNNCFLLTRIIIPETVKIIQKEAFCGCTSLKVIAPYYSDVNIKFQQGCCEIVDSRIPPLYRNWNENNKEKIVEISFKFNDEKYLDVHKYSASTSISNIVHNDIEMYSSSPELLVGRNIFCTTYFYDIGKLLVGSNYFGKQYLRLYNKPCFTSVSYSFVGNNFSVFQGYDLALTCLYQIINNHSHFFEFLEKCDLMQEKNLNVNIGLSATLFNEELPLIHSSLPVSVKEIGDKAFCHCSRLNWIGIEGCTIFGHNVFGGCKSMKKVIISNNQSGIFEGHIPSDITTEYSYNK